MLTLSHSVSDRNADPILEFAKPVKEHLITSDTVLEDYQVMMDLEAITGTDSGDDAYGLEVETDGNNLALLTEDGQVIPFWIEEHTGRARIWAKMPLISPNTRVKLLEYPRNYFPTLNDGDATFPFFDDFPGSSLDGSKWNSPGGGSVSINGGILQWDLGSSVGENSIVSKAGVSGDGYSIRSKCRYTTNIYEHNTGISIRCNTNAKNQGIYCNSGSVIQLIETSVETGTTIFSPSVQSTWYTFETTAIANTMYGRVNDGSWGSWDRAALTGNFGLHAANYATGTHTSQYDWVLIRKYTATEPTHSSWNDISIPSGDTGRFRYKKTHILTGDSGWSGDQTGYPIMLKVYRTSGTDSGESVYVDTNVRTDYRDLLFMDGNGCILPFWIESIDTTNNYATVWVRMPTIAKTGNTTLYMLYGNPRATDRSSGEATFDFFDDFLGSAVDTDVWTTTGSSSVSDGILTVSGASSDLNSKTSFALNSIGGAVRGRAKFVNTFGAFGFQSGIGSRAVIASWYAHPCTTLTGAGTFGSDNLYSYNVYYNFDILYPTSGNIIYKANGAQISTGTVTAAEQAVHIKTGDGETSGTIYIDWIAVRKYVSPEPAHGSWSTSEV